jgi:diacylglycerol kinase (ATP)
LDHFVFIINTKSGRHRPEVLEARIQSAIDSFQLSAECHQTRDAQHTAEIIQTSLVKGKNIFIAVGGDGTVNTLARNLVHQDAKLGIIPRGSGNGLARHLAMPRDIHSCIQRLIRKKTISVDGIKINGYWSFNVAGIGFDGYISTLFGQNGKRGMTNYMRLINSEYKAYQPIVMEIRYDNEFIVKPVFQLAIANASQYGNNAIVAPFASLEDQLLDISMITKVPMSLLPAFFLKVFSGNIHRSKYWQSIKTDKLLVTTSRPVHFHTDGDGRGMSEHFDIEMIPSCLQLIY